MELQLSLGNQFVWALVNPLGKGFIKETRHERGFQEVNLIFTQSQPGPVKIYLDDYPAWAQTQIKSAIRSGQLRSTGAKIDTVLEPKTLEKPEITEVQQDAKPPRPKGPGAKK